MFTPKHISVDSTTKSHWPSAWTCNCRRRSSSFQNQPHRPANIPVCIAHLKSIPSYSTTSPLPKTQRETSMTPPPSERNPPSQPSSQPSPPSASNHVGGKASPTRFFPAGTTPFRARKIHKMAVVAHKQEGKRASSRRPTRSHTAPAAPSRPSSPDGTDDRFRPALAIAPSSPSRPASFLDIPQRLPRRLAHDKRSKVLANWFLAAATTLFD
ncbi:hypothetical protein QBC39DRAFT_364292 [Podospora conica]|nr:hypothetical protein QBC39DRAFT_364292 [Schizothecium conicum]